MCEHLKKAEDYIKSKGIKESWRGQPWTENCREWIYFDCVLSPQNLKTKLQLEDFVQVHDYSDTKAGSELGLICSICKDGIMGMHPESSIAKQMPVIE
jgi:hypothetical protein